MDRNCAVGKLAWIGRFLGATQKQLPFLLAGMLLATGVHSLYGCAAGYGGPYALSVGGSVCTLPSATISGYTKGSCSGGFETVTVSGNSSGQYTYSGVGSPGGNVYFFADSGANWTNSSGFQEVYGSGTGTYSSYFTGTGSGSFGNQSSNATPAIDCPMYSFNAFTRSLLTAEPQSSVPATTDERRSSQGGST